MGHHFQESVNRFFSFFLLGLGWAQWEEGNNNIFFSIVMWEGIFEGGLGEQSHFCLFLIVALYL